MRSWGICYECGRDLMLAEADSQRFACPRCGNTVSFEAIEAFERASDYCLRKDIDQFWDIAPGMLADVDEY
jgi:predicted RNA-binding Zn-ribbon protein involved in translation (DUF1610 family)